MPRIATEIAPVSSETMTTTASEFSLMPMPARWRVPRSRLMFTLWDSGRMQPAASSRPSRMMTAPSCIAALTKKMFFKSWLDTCASTMVPVRAISSSFMLRSKTISMPVRDSDISAQASTVWAMVVSMTLFCWTRAKGLSVLSLLEPTCSSRRRISGWKMTISAITPHVTIALRIELMVLRRSSTLSTSASRYTSTPLPSVAARERPTSFSARYSRYASSAISSQSVSAMVPT